VNTEFVYAPKAQQRLWLADQLTPESAVYLGNFFLRLRGTLDIGALEAALGAIVARHEVLRTSLCERDGEIAGLLQPAGKLRLNVTDTPACDLDAALRTEAADPVDVASGPPIRFRLLRLSAREHVLCLGIHHVAADRGSIQVLYDELGAGYRRFIAPAGGSPGPGSPGPGPPPLAAQFRAIAAAEDARHDAGELAGLIEAQRAVLGDREAFELPPDLPRPAVRTGAGATRDAEDLPGETLRRLTALGRDRAASLYMVLLAACQTVLYRYTGRPDVTTGTSVSTRDELSTALIGPFFGLLVLPGDISGNPAFADLVTRVRDIALDAYETRAVPFDTLVAELGIVRDPARTPLFQILVDLVPPARLPSLPGIEVTDILTPGSGAKYDLTIEFRAEQTLGFSVEYDSALYQPATIERLIRHLRAVLLAVAEDPRVRVEDVPMLGADEIAELRALAEPERPPLPGLCLHELFARQAAATPDTIAVRDDDGTTWTYAELDRRATAIACGLAALGVGPDVPVAVLLERTPRLLAVLFGILKAGGAYVPVDPDSSPARIGAVLGRSGAPVCVVPAAGPRIADIRRAAAAAGCRLVAPDEVARHGAGAARPPLVGPGNLCSIYFTSGSTGEPKGVASTHRGWAGQLANLQQRYRLTGGRAILWKTPLTFDDVAREIFWPLMLGATVAVLPEGLHRDPRALLAAAIRHRIPWLQFVPGMLALFLDEIGPGHLGGLAGLRDIVSDGDRLPPATAAAFAERLGRPLGTRLHNHWGTTEVSIDSTHHVCTEADAAAGPAAAAASGAIALGRPMENHEVHVLGPGLSLAPFGAVGELAIGGAGLARGYLGDPGRTARAFVPHPFRPGERLYRTGDNGRWGTGGELIYCGRRDHQVKVRGVRVELGEVESAARSFATIGDAVAALWEPAPGDRRIVLYAACAVSGGSRDAIRAALSDHLAARLVPQAVPSALVLLDRLPRNPSGKVDRRALPPPDAGSVTSRPYVPPATDAEAVIAGIWAEVLGRPTGKLGADDDFFAIGGHSLLVTRAVNRMRQAFAVDMSVRLVFEHSTVRAAAARVEDLVLAEVEALSDTEAERLAARTTA
jgi:amino acid adenylation domain-containing protein